MPQPILNTQSPLHKSHMMNIKIGAYTLRALGKCDVGQSIVVYEQRVLGIEAAEGTDALIERCAKLRQGGVGGVMVKMMKENQNPMMDPPVIGVNTVRQMQRYGYDGIAVQKDKVIILDVHEILNQLDDRFFLNILDDTE
nr:LpxI family protein [Candidatus Sarmatiella mevalonica]